MRGFHLVGCDGADLLGRLDCSAEVAGSAGAGSGDPACRTHRLDAPAVEGRVVSAGPASPEAEACTHGDAAAGTLRGARFGVRSNPFPFVKQ